jgi:hypothetical protein
MSHSDYAFAIVPNLLVALDKFGVAVCQHRPLWLKCKEKRSAAEERFEVPAKLRRNEANDRRGQQPFASGPL